MCVNNLSKVALDSATAGIEPATFSRKSNALTTAPPSHTVRFNTFFDNLLVTYFLGHLYIWVTSLHRETSLQILLGNNANPPITD